MTKETLIPDLVKKSYVTAVVTHYLVEYFKNSEYRVFVDHFFYRDNSARRFGISVIHKDTQVLNFVIAVETKRELAERELSTCRELKIPNCLMINCVNGNCIYYRMNPDGVHSLADVGSVFPGLRDIVGAAVVESELLSLTKEISSGESSHDL